MKNGFLTHSAPKNQRNKIKWRVASVMLAGIALLFAFQGFSKAEDDGHDATAITNCTDLTMINITQAGRYFLTSDLKQCNPGISITVSDVKLELRGHTIQGASGTGASMISVNGGAAGVSNIEIAGPGTVGGGSAGIDFENVHGSRVHNLVVVGNNFGGIAVNVSDPNTSSTDNEFRDNVVTGNFVDGITVNGGTNNEFRDNVVTGNINNGITVNGGSENRFIHNNLSGNVEGLVLLNANNDIVRRNTADSNISSGIDVGGPGSGNTIENNTALGNVNGFDLTDKSGGCTQNNWTHNSFNTNSPACIQ